MDFTALFKAPEAEGKEKHVPVIERGSGHNGTHDNVVIVMVGKETPHPNTLEHHIVWIELYGVKKENDQVVYIGRADFAPTTADPTATFKVLDLDQYKALGAVSYCNIHGLWKNTFEL
ncbi:putative superoxide reductase [Methanimicrococcus sp. At1]|uniref:Superoxide reductase n=1 Tax=Methanimicrococcus hacksteinii TaxID=3028293 RepID=A0ABU3VQH7_9EURY|nr:desulfoferrodoxin family protein [Methanimicrococcus sp. At1]MDV0445668.1 putative superoxide reductase [Methanimicrococcus sp. At1]